MAFDFFQWLLGWSIQVWVLQCEGLPPGPVWAIWGSLHHQWDWDLFQFISSYSMREKAVRELLTRHCQLLETPESWAKETFLTQKLCVPAEWIHEAKAVRAHMESDKHLEALYLFKAGHWNRCHKLIIRHLASGECFTLRPVSPGITPNSSKLWTPQWVMPEMICSMGRGRCESVNQITLCESSLCRRGLARMRG